MLCAEFRATVIPHKALCRKVMHFSIRIDHAYKACPEMDVPSSIITALTCIALTSSSILVASFSCFENTLIAYRWKTCELIRSLLDMISTPLTLSHGRALQVEGPGVYRSRIRHIVDVKVQPLSAASLRASPYLKLDKQAVLVGPYGLSCPATWLPHIGVFFKLKS